MNIEEAKEYIKMIIRKQEIPDSAKALGYVYATEAIETVLSELKKKDEVINEMAEQLVGLPIYDEKEVMVIFKNEEEVKEYFTNKVEREGK